MIKSTIECLRCRTVMEQGYVMDRGHGSTPAGVATWVSGVAEQSWWTGLKLKGRDQVPLETFLCRNCGYVEFRSANRLHD